MHQVMEATNTIRDALAIQIEPVYGLTTMHASLRAFQVDPHHPLSDDIVKAGSYAFGMIALGKFILRLPAEVLEEELPRLKGTLISVRVPLIILSSIGSNTRSFRV
jgi:CLIP-associating protein 1/2